MNDRKRGILVTTSTFPRWKDDNEPPFVFELAKRLTDKWEVHVLAPHAVGAADFEMMDGVFVHRFRYATEGLENLCYQGGMLARLRAKPHRFLLLPLFFLFQYIAARNVIRRFDINTIHAHWIIPQGLIAAILKLFSRRRLSMLTTLHGADLFALQGYFAKWLKIFVLRRSNRITVVSKAMQIEVERLGVEANKLSVIPMGTDLQHSFIPMPDKRKPGMFVFVGRLVPKKGVEYLLIAFAEVVKEEPNCRLLIAGSGPLEESLMEQANKLGIDKKTTFLGAVVNEQLPAVYQCADIAVFPFITTPEGDQEGFGLVLVEALGCGCAVIASDMPAVRDILSNEETGIVVPQKNPQQLASIMIKLYKDPELCRRLAQRGRTYVMGHFGWENVTQRYADVLESLNGE